VFTFTQCHRTPTGRKFIGDIFYFFHTPTAAVSIRQPNPLDLIIVELFVLIIMGSGYEILAMVAINSLSCGARA
jgi:hypothetical protein